MAKRRFIETAEMGSPIEAAIDLAMSRQREILSVYRPGNEKQARVHESVASTMVVGGANRSGKSYTSFCEAASRMTGERVFGLDDKVVPSRFHIPKAGETSRYWMVGYNLDHIGQTFYRMFFEPGMGGGFKIIFDQNLGRYATFNPNNAWHEAHKDKAEVAEPLIPARLIKEESWCWNQYGGGQAKKCFSSVELTNGALIYAFPSTTPQAKQGDPIHGLLIDEDVKSGGHVPEYLMRLTDHEGWVLWPAWPHDENYVLTNLIEYCIKAMENGDSRFEYVLLTLTENTFFTTKTIQLSMDRMAAVSDDDELIERRIFGIQGYEGRRMYDFNPMLQGISGKTLQRPVPDLDEHGPRGALQKVYREHGEFPKEWTRYLAIDPSTTRTAVLFGVVPPPEVNGVTVPPSVIVESEIVLKRATPDVLAVAIKEVIGSRKYESFVIDRNFGRQRHFASGGANVFEILAESFRKHDISSRTTKEWCVPGCNVPEERHTRVREMLLGANRGTEALYVLLDFTPHLQKEIRRYNKKLVKEKGVERIEEVPENPRVFDVMAALEYLCHYIYDMMQCGQHYVHPTIYGGDDSMSNLAALARGGDEDSYIHLGPGTKA